MNPRRPPIIIRLLRKIGARLLRSRGYSDYFAPRLAEEIINDFFHGARIGMKRRWWAYRHGFLGDTIVNYGLTPENYHEYLADFHYLKLHPLNGVWSKWIDDKLTTRYVLEPFAEYLPKYYFHLCGPEIFPLMDCPRGLPTGVNGILNMLKKEKQLAVKIVSGTGGEGFHKLEWRDEKILVSNRPVSAAELQQSISVWSNFVVTEYLTPHPDLRRIYPHTANTVRVCTVREEGQRAAIIGANLRFGTSQSGVIDNVAAGGIACGVRLDDGVLYRPGRYERARFVEVPVHPDTGTAIQGTLPFWELIKEKVLQICDYLPQLSYLGFDVVITERSFKIIEINSHQSAQVQTYNPLLRDPASRRYFQRALRAKGFDLERG